MLAGVLGYALIDAFGERPAAATTPVAAPPQQVSDSIFSTYLIPFEVVSVLLLAALDRRHRPGAGGTDAVLLNQFLLLGAVLFCIGVYGVLARRNGVLVLMSIELILNAVNINLVAFGAFRHDVAGQVFALFVIAVAAAEVGVGLAIVLLIYRNRRTSTSTRSISMKG